ncbi:hypothetical protein RUND412_010518 [Rhizina undulata]
MDSEVMDENKMVINYSDGETKHHPGPTQTEKVVTGKDLSYNYFRQVANGNAKDILWRKQIGQELANSFGISSVDDDWILKNFQLPKGYTLFEHLKGREEGKDRSDVYLFGHPSGKRYRSAREFKPHILYLANFPTDAGESSRPDITCSCCLCAGGKGAKGRNAPIVAKRSAGKHADPIFQARRKANAEELLHAQETAGWVLRKGELVWVWIPETKAVLAGRSMGKWTWGAAIVFESPSSNTLLKITKPAEDGGLADIGNDDTSIWVRDENKTYVVQLCSESNGPEGLLSGIPQERIKPWLARHECFLQQEDEHPSVEYGRRVAETFSLFDRSPDVLSDERISWEGFFLGAEKIFVGEPVRIASPVGPDKEDVLVIEKISTATTHPAGNGGENSSSRKMTVTYLEGSVYTCHPNSASIPITPEQVAELPLRMRSRAGNGDSIQWYIRNCDQEKGELSLKMILGRWYEQQAVEEWLSSSLLSRESQTYGARLQEKKVKIWKGSRMESIGWKGIMNFLTNKYGKSNGVEIRKFEMNKMALANAQSFTETTGMELDETPIVDGNQSLNHSVSQMNPVVAGPSGTKAGKSLKRKRSPDLAQDENSMLE